MCIRVGNFLLFCIVAAVCIGVLNHISTHPPRYIAAYSLAKTTTDETTCLALNMYHEARGEGERGMRAVAAVTLNRMLHPTLWDATICGVVFETARSGCQFEWWCDGRSDWPRDIMTWNLVYQLAGSILEEASRGMFKDETKGAYFYHAVGRTWSGEWTANLKQGKTIGRHQFYLLRQ